MESTSAVSIQDGKPAHVSTSFVYDPTDLCPICMERPKRIPYYPHTSPEGQICNPPALCRRCAVNKCIYCRIDQPPRDNLSFTKHLVDVVCDCFTLLYIKIYPIATEIIWNQTCIIIKDKRGQELCAFRRDDPSGFDRLLWFMIFYGDYGDSVYKYELTDAKGKPIPKYRLPPSVWFTKTPKKPIQRGILELDEDKLQFIYQSTKDDPITNKEPKFALLKMLVVIMETYKDPEDRSHAFDCKEDPTCKALTQRDFEAFQDLDKFRQLSINPRFFNDANSLGMPMNLNQF